MANLNTIQKHVLFVCTGNTCRSPMAAAIFNHFAEQKNLNWFASSAGIATETGLLVTKEAIQVLKDYDIHIEDHISHQLDERMLNDTDIVITMTNTQKDLLKIYFPDKKDKIFSLMEYADSDEEIEDPYGQGLKKYQQIAADLMVMIPKIIKRLTT